jgi:hypothetical protein
MRKTSLNNAESAHCSAWWIVGSYGISVNDGIVALVRALSVGDAIDQYGRGCARVRTTVEYHARFNFDNFAVFVCVMFHPDFGWMTMHVSKKTLFAAVLHLDRFASSQSEQTTVHLQTDVFASAKCTTYTAKDKPNIVLGERQASGNLTAIFVQPLRGDMQFNTTAT